MPAILRPSQAPLAKACLNDLGVSTPHFRTILELEDMSQEAEKVSGSQNMMEKEQDVWKR